MSWILAKDNPTKLVVTTVHGVYEINRTTNLIYVASSSSLSDMAPLLANPITRNFFKPVVGGRPQNSGPLRPIQGMTYPRL